MLSDTLFGDQARRHTETTEELSSFRIWHVTKHNNGRDNRQTVERVIFLSILLTRLQTTLRWSTSGYFSFCSGECSHNRGWGHDPLTTLRRFTSVISASVLASTPIIGWGHDPLTTLGRFTSGYFSLCSGECSHNWVVAWF